MITIEQLYALYTQCSTLTTDSRNISNGAMFFALKGDNFDGNDFALKSLEAGANYAVVDRPSLGANPKCIVVDNVLRTLQDLARYHRQHFDIPILAITGTNGKTTTKELINAVLSKKYNTIATQGNLNNHIGVPLTLFRLSEQTQIAIVEMGASAPGEINSSVNIALPNYGLITNVGKAHLLGFGSFEGVKRTKGELYDFLQNHSGSVFCNSDNPHLREMVAMRPKLEPLFYGLTYSGAKILPVSTEEPFLRIEVPSQEGKCTICTHLVGGYNADNVLAALCVGEYFKVPFDLAVEAIEQYIPSNNRSQMVKTSRNLLIIDAYNANPTSMRASLSNFADTIFDGKTLVVGDMLELGADSVSEHEEILRLAENICAQENIFAVGNEFTTAAHNIGAKINLFADSESLKIYFETHPISNKTILIKGSRGTKLEKIIPIL